MDSQIVSDMITFLFDAYQSALGTLPVISAWLKSLASPNAVLWYVLGLLTLPLFQKVRIRIAFWRMRSRLARKVKGQPSRLISSAMSVLSKTYPEATIEIRKEEIKNILGILAKIVEIVGRSPTADWGKLWSKVDSSWLNNFISKCRMIQEPALQEAMARAFVYEATTPGRFGQRDIDILAAIHIRDWETFTAICNFACCINGRITPVVFNYADDVYKKAGLEAEELDSLIAAGLVTQGGTGDFYTLKIHNKGLRVSYFDEEDFIVRPLSAPIPRNYFGRTLTQADPLDKSLNVGVVDFTQVGRGLGFLTLCSKVDGFTEYLRCHWDVYLRN